MELGHNKDVGSNIDLGQERSQCKHFSLWPWKPGLQIYNNVILVLTYESTNKAYRLQIRPCTVNAMAKFV